MTQEEIVYYIIDKKIPTSFCYNNSRFDLWLLGIGTYTTTSPYDYNVKFPTFSDSLSSGFQISFYDYNNDIWKSERETFEQCLGEFLIWWEINKSRFTDIEFYEG